MHREPSWRKLLASSFWVCGHRGGLHCHFNCECLKTSCGRKHMTIVIMLCVVCVCARVFVCVCVCVCNCVVVLCWSLTHNHGVVCASRKNGLLQAPFFEPRRAIEEHIYDIGPDWTVTLILRLYCPAVGSVQRLAADGTLRAFDSSTRGLLTFAFLAFVRSCIYKS